MNIADDQPWSPFPVQDWSTLPADPLGSVAVNPTWPAPTAATTLVEAARHFRACRRTCRRCRIRGQLGGRRRQSQQG